MRYGPDEDDGPESVQGEKTQPTCVVNSLFMRVFAVVGNAGGDVVDEDEEIENGHHREQEHSEGNVLEHGMPFSGEFPPVCGRQCSKERERFQPVAALVPARLWGSTFAQTATVDGWHQA